MDTAGLAIAVFDLVCKVAKKTHEILCDYRNFDEESQELARQVIEEHDRTRTLKCLLFEPAVAYNGQCLFMQFHHDIQRQILFRQKEVFKIIEEAVELFEEQQLEATADLVSSVVRTELTPPTGTIIKRKSSPRIRLKWALWEKKRLKSIVSSFTRSNDKVYVQVQLLCHASSVGVDLKHLDRLANDEHSKKLGYDLPAQLHLTTTGMHALNGSLEIKDETLFRNLAASNSVVDGISMVELSGSMSVVEFRNYAPDRTEPVPIPERTRGRVELLAHLLRQQKDAAFRTLSCKGWSLDTRLNRVAFLFEIPDDMEGTPYSLLRLYESKKVRPALGERLRLAKHLANSISGLQLVEWVHESIRSENIVFFPRGPQNGETLSEEERLVIAQPWVMGFEFSRPELDFSSGRQDVNPARNVYRHPERQNQPQKPFQKIHDIYGLGVVLLEIGLWRSVLSLERAGFKNVTDPWTIQDYLVKKARKALPREIGEKYAQLVVRCLTGAFDVDKDSKNGLKLQQAFREQVVDVLEYAADSIG
ncbi:hypothetical protein BU23DRAFT_603414 [Bimuria novae-zelandiae CBS 107.79]|uniref:DUF7580 domain-containing protein n=1 Tax=Bimuria novae-zelandiae CBS 107.79 TaxID=1447943 RepID=A0A6A5UN30_9PLEO|nr:hypothetical protein BU23DRAFT_603414 [Bimuria novae-zelandiae CBS 107.79]